METYSSIQQIVALSTTENEYISTKDVARALEIRSVLAECDMTLKMKGNTDVTAGRATAACITWVRDYHGCSGRGQKAWFIGVWRTQRSRLGVEDDRFDFAFERNTSSTTNEFIELELTDGGSKFPRG